MKLRNIFTILASLLIIAFTGCEKEEERVLDEVQVSQSYIAIPKAGGSVEITVTAKDKWEIADSPEWLSVTPAKGEAGETKVTFSANAVEGANNATIHLTCGKAVQTINIIQGIAELRIYTVEEILAFTDADKGKTVTVSGTITKITGPSYGEFYIKGDTGAELLIYNSQPSFDQMKPSVGDIVTVEGPFTIYNGTYELNKGSVITGVIRSLIQLEEKEFVVEKEGGDIDVPVTVKGNGVKVSIDEAGAEWLSFVGTSSKGLMFNCASYEVKQGPRTATVTLTTKSGDRVSEGQFTVEQFGITPDPISVTEALAQPKGTWLTVKGIVTGLNNKGFILTDEAGVSIQGYPNATPTVKIGDEILLTGNYSIYNKVAQIEKPVIRTISDGNKVEYPAAKKVTEALIKEMDGNKVNPTVYVELTGVPSGKYGDILIEGSDGYGISPYQALKSFNYPADYEGKTVTIRGYVLQVYKAKGDDYSKTLRVNVVSIEEAK